MRYIYLFNACILSGACSSLGGDFSRSDYSRVVSSLDIDQVVCGKKQGRVIELKSDPDFRYLDIRSLGPLPYDFDDNVCVRGEVTYIGCVTGPGICVDWSTDYAIAIKSVVSD